MHVLNENIYIKKEGREIFLKNCKNIKASRCLVQLSPAIHLKVWGKHFELEYIINPSKNLIES